MSKLNIHPYSLIPERLRELSVSDRELVLPYPEVLEATYIWYQNNIPILRWAGWIQYADGKVGHSTKFQGLDSGPPGETESFDDYIQRTENNCRVTIEKANEEWKLFPEIPDGKLLFCIDYSGWVDPREW